MACAYYGGGVTHPKYRPKRHYNLSLFGLLRYFVPVVVAPSPGVFHFNPLPLLLQPTLIRLRHLRRRLPFPHQVKSHLFLPTHPYPCPLLPLRCLAQVQNQSRRNILRDCIMPLLNVGFHWLKSRPLFRRLRQGVLPPYIQPPPW